MRLPRVMCTALAAPLFLAACSSGGSQTNSDAPSTFLDLARPAAIEQISISNLITDITGVPADDWTASRHITLTINQNGNHTPEIEYTINTAATLTDAARNRAGGDAWLCTELPGDRSCGRVGIGFGENLVIRDNGAARIYLSQPGRVAEPSANDVIAAFVVALPPAPELAAAPCALTRGTGTFNETTFTVTVEHAGDCTPSAAHISRLVSVSPSKANPGEWGTLVPADSAEITNHTAAETTVRFTAPWTSYRVTGGQYLSDPTYVLVGVAPLAPNTMPAGIAIPVTPSA